MRSFFKILKVADIKYLRFSIVYLTVGFIITLLGIYGARIAGTVSQEALLQNRTGVNEYIFIMGFVAAFDIILNTISAYLSSRNIEYVWYTLKNHFARYLLDISYQDLSKKSFGEYLSLHLNDINMVGWFISYSIYTHLTSILALIVSATFMCLTNPLLTICYFITFPLFVLLQTKISKPLGNQWKRVSENLAQCNDVILDGLQNTAVIKAYSLEGNVEKRYSTAYTDYFSTFASYVKTKVIMDSAGINLSVIPVIMVALLSGIQVVNKKMSIAEFIAFNAISEFSGIWLRELPSIFADFRSSFTNINRYLDNTKFLPETSADHKSSILNVENSTNTTAIELKNVCYSYSSKNAAITDVTFTIPRGMNVALVGKSGSGKSSILKIILGLYLPDSGDVFVNGANAKNMGVNTLRSQIAYIPQDSYLYSESIRDNIIAGSEENERKLEESCRAAEILDYVQGLPNKFETVISESAENISGGQKQRIALARALYRDAPILLFDEATSSLDTKTELAVLEAFFKSIKGKGKSTLVVTHRKAAVLACDIIMLIEGGKIKHMGTYEELLLKSCDFKEMFEKEYYA